MPFRYHWTYDLEVGFGAIDSQHQELFRRANDFFDAIQQGHGKATLLQTMGFLSEYVERHFEDEEDYMKRHRYPGFSEHRNEHLAFAVQVREINRSLHRDLTSVVRLQQHITQWLVQHIKIQDRALAAFLRQKTQRP